MDIEEDICNMAHHKWWPPP